MSNRTHHKESAQLRQNIADRDIVINTLNKEKDLLNGTVDNLIQERDDLHRQIGALKGELLLAVAAMAGKSEELLNIKHALEAKTKEHLDLVQACQNASYGEAKVAQLEAAGLGGGYDEAKAANFVSPQGEGLEVS